ncbi:uncharacterized protein LOC132200225 [Neocloeon triangulifer]|uniref:uncharacterized protein LOC132200225 n=1 Tax=Neocloeon triangulifer TaxID=2078957 RepID=UPI00286F7169|nr:uncharacterized protein LOC132200225 [Neocloeon triangulifer]
MDVQPSTLEEACQMIHELRERHRSQAHQLLSWRRRAKAQEEMMAKLAREHAEQLKGLSSQLLLLEAGLCRKQKEIRTLLMNRDKCVMRQSRTIRVLQQRLADSGLDPSLLDTNEVDLAADNDSAVVLEDGSAMDLQLALPLSSVLRYNSTTAAVQRSISDATKFSSSGAGGKRGSNSFLRRPEVLETVYSVEEDQDSEEPPKQSTPERPHSVSDCTVPAVDENSPITDSEMLNHNSVSNEDSERKLLRRQPPLRTSRVDLEEPPSWIPAPPAGGQQHQFNRVMGNNHRSVTKPKDVKYKRINKAKSKSLEELRGRLRVEPQSPA